VKPYYQDDFATLYHADCREVMAGLTFDAVVTDPPYGIEGGSGGDARDFGKGRYEASSWEDSPAYISRVCVAVVEALVGRGVPVAVTPGIRHLSLYPAPRDMGCFWTPAASTHGPWGFTTFQPILYYGKDHRAGKGAYPSGKAVTDAAEKNGHPCPKPLSAWAWLVDKVCPPTGVVFDPFVGSGTTLRAAKDRGRKAIGVEIEERFCEIAVKRLGQEVLDFGEVAA
jgi:site-specific DNA-methyltransferase (adenine-specific)